MQASLAVEAYGENGIRQRTFIHEASREGQCPVQFIKSGQYLPLIWKSTTRRPGSVWMMKSLSTLEALILLHDILQGSTSIVRNIELYSLV